MVFRYEVIRIWLEPPEKLLRAGLAVLPLAPVSNVARTSQATSLPSASQPNLAKTRAGWRLVVAAMLSGRV